MSFLSGPKSSPNMSAPPSPQVNTEPAAPDTEKLKRAGRASLLLSGGPEGVLGKAKTGRSSLLSAT